MANSQQEAPESPALVGWKSQLSQDAFLPEDMMINVASPPEGGTRQRAVGWRPLPPIPSTLRKDGSVKDAMAINMTIHHKCGEFYSWYLIRSCFWKSLKRDGWRFHTNQMLIFRLTNFETRTARSSTPSMNGT